MNCTQEYLFFSIIQVNAAYGWLRRRITLLIYAFDKINPIRNFWKHLKNETKKKKNPETFYNSDALFSHAPISDIPLLDSFLIWYTVAMQSPDARFHISKGDNTTCNGQHMPTFKCGLQKK